MHPTQQKIIELSKKYNISELSYRKIGEIIGGEHPQTVKYHIQKLSDKGLINNNSFDFLKKFSNELSNQPKFSEIPVLGQADCGIATSIAEQRIDGYLKISEKLLKGYRSLYALRARGDSMNMVSVNGKSIEDGDYVLVDYSYKCPKNGECVVSIIDGCANIKVFMFDKIYSQILLVSKSKNNYPPIVIDSNEQFLISGKVIDVIKVNV